MPSTVDDELQQIADSLDPVNLDWQTVVSAIEFGVSTINARVRFWHEPRIRAGWTTRHDVALSIKRALDEHGIVIAFPQRVLWQGAAGDASSELEAR